MKQKLLEVNLPEMNFEILMEREEGKKKSFGFGVNIYSEVPM